MDGHAALAGDTGEDGRATALGGNSGWLSQRVSAALRWAWPRHPIQATMRI